jgi:thioredoxin-like negative regulator of GroEL
MTKKRPLTQRATPSPPAGKKNNSLMTILVLAGLGVVIAGILLLKGQQQPAATAISAPAAASLVFAGPPSEQFQQSLAARHPTVVFMHSNNCIPCQAMMEVVDEVYPEFATQVVLVDVDVYDRTNTALMQQLGLRVIPTTVFFDRQGQGQQFMGVMEPDDLRDTLRQLAQGG